MKRILHLYSQFVAVANRLSSVVLLVLRVWMARVFFISGLTKIRDFDNAVALFADEYKVPVLPPELAATLGTVFELCCPVLLLFGLATRLATLPLLAMTAVIYLTYDQGVEVLYWGMLLAVILSVGPGQFSLDHLLAQRRK